MYMRCVWCYIFMCVCVIEKWYFFTKPRSHEPVKQFIFKCDRRWREKNWHVLTTSSLINVIRSFEASWEMVTGGKKQRFDVIWMEKSHNVIKRPQEPGTGMTIRLHQFIHLLQTHFISPDLTHTNTHTHKTLKLMMWRSEPWMAEVVAINISRNSRCPCDPAASYALVGLWSRRVVHASTPGGF